MEEEIPMSYEVALKQLHQILDEIENHNSTVDEILNKAKLAKELLTYCQNRLRKIEENTNQII